MMFFLPITTLFITGLMAALAFIGVRKTLTKELNLCITKVTYIQREHRATTNKLLSMNKTAKILRVSRKTAKAAYLLAIPGPPKATAYTALNAVKYSQKVFRLRQNYLIQKSHLKTVKFYKSMLLNGFMQKSYNFPNLKIRKTHKESDSPGYELIDDYTKKKSLVFFKYINLLEYVPKSLVRFLKQKNFSHIQKLNCGSTLLEKDKKAWNIKLIMGK